jgi:23S rRNA (guanosine2251-2'-O)-methyltransferase
VNRESNEANWIYGINAVRETLRGDRDVFGIYLSSRKRAKITHDISSIARNKGIPIKIVDAPFFSSFPKGHQGIAARVGQGKVYQLDDLLKLSGQRREAPFYIIIDGIVDPVNLGSVIRTAEVGGVHGIIMQKRRIASGGTVSKASAGAVEFMPVVRVANIKHVIRELGEENIVVYGAEADSKEEYWSVDFTVPLALVIGSEGKGLRETVKKYCDSMIGIPVRGRINSLNVRQRLASQ